jgi:peptidoglycan/LPS O-acetylase OafA/YrhL
VNEAGASRIHSMDALRASSMFLLVPVHAANLLSTNGRGGGWTTSIYWTVHVFRLPLFFAMSGFFLVLLLSRKGLDRTIRNRTLRILGPLAIGLVTLVPLLFLASEVTGVAIHVDGSAASGSPFVFQPSFLWFLWYLLIIDSVAIACFLLVPRLLRIGSEAMRAAISKPLIGITLLAVPTALFLLSAPNWMLAPDANTFVPELPALAYYALFFGLGATLSANRGLIDRASHDVWAWAACALAATIPAAILFSLHNSPQYDQLPYIHFAAMLIYAAATWTTLLALVGLANRYLTRPRPRLRYIADSSYWIYLSHMPAMVLIVGLLGTWSLGAGPTFLLVTAAALAFSLLTYPLFVRYTAIGWLLNGRRTRPARKAVAPLPTQPAAAATPRA